MNLRLMGSTDLVQRCAAILERAGLPGRIYPQRHGAGSRLYVEVDDRKAAELAERVEQGASQEKRAKHQRPKARLS